MQMLRNAGRIGLSAMALQANDRFALALQLCLPFLGRRDSEARLVWSVRLGRIFQAVK